MSAWRRILVAVDASPLSMAAMEAAAALAGRLGAEVEAVFVEDVNLRRLVAHPHVHSFSLSAVGSRVHDDALLEKALELQSLAARRALERAAAVAEIRAIFTLRRGMVAAELLAAAESADLVCLGWSGRARPVRRLGSIARALMQSAPRPVMALRRPGFERVVALWDGSEPARRALAVAAVLAARDGGEVGIIAPSAALLPEAQAFLAEWGVGAHLSRIGRAPAVVETLAPDSLLVAAAESGVAPEQAPCSVVMAR
ncbi:MAG: universal stress protein [Pseudomonadota bacterium]